MSDLNSFGIAVKNIANEIEPLLRSHADIARVRIARSATTRFMKDSGATNPQAQKELGKNPATGEGTLRIVSSRLARSLVGAQQGESREMIFDTEMKDGTLEMIFGSSVPYAGVHEDGFVGEVSIPEHSRRITQAFGRQIEPKTVNVSAHSKKMNIQPRPYLAPALESELSGIQSGLADALMELL